jgi:hypothetical protein
MPSNQISNWVWAGKSGKFQGHWNDAFAQNVWTWLSGINGGSPPRRRSNECAKDI